VGTRHGTETNDPKKREQKKPINKTNIESDEQHGSHG
jgi:hypothetical protein